MSLKEYQTLLRSKLRQYPDFPEKGILFEDILPIFQDPESSKALVEAFALHVKEAYPDKKVDYVVAAEARGFLFGPALAMTLNAGFVPVRKPGKLPGEVVSATFVKEYGKDVFEMQKDAIPPNSTVLFVDDVIATGGSAAAGGELVKKLGSSVLAYLFIMELEFLKGRDKLDAPVFTLLSGQDEKSE